MNPDSPPTDDLALITQMRAGTHFLCGALRVALEATVYRPADGRRYTAIADDEILKGLHTESRIDLPRVNSGHRIYFSHYYHPHIQVLPPMRRISLIGFPLDSFYSDGIVYSEASPPHPGPSGTRPRAADYVLRLGTPEWKLLESRMSENAAWLEEITDDGRHLIVRYEDLFIDFEACAARLSRFTGGFRNPLPRPVINPRRTYWTERYLSAFDRPALAALWRLFAPAVERFYPERLKSLKACV